MGFISSLKSRITGSQHLMTLQDAVEIIQAYAQCLERRSESASIVVDSIMLPYNKETIKNALITAMKKSEEAAQKRHLATGYLELADFQNGVGDKLIGLDLSNLDVANMNVESGDVDALAEQVSQTQQDFDHWTLLMNTEKTLLLAELKEAGFESPL